MGLKYLSGWEFIVLTMTTAAMYCMPINSLDVWAMVTLGLAEIWTTDPLSMIPHQVETQLIASQPFPVSVSGLIPSLSAAPVPCWFRKSVSVSVSVYFHRLCTGKLIKSTDMARNNQGIALHKRVFHLFVHSWAFCFKKGKVQSVNSLLDLQTF